MSTDHLDAVLADIDAHEEGALARLAEFLSIPSIGTDPAYKAQTRDAALWLAADIRAIGGKADLIETAGHPMVVGSAGPEDAARHVLFYGHYDVQPVDPLGLWDRDPFDPAIAEGDEGPEIRARGACDDKGQLMTFVEAARAWIATAGDLPCRVTFFFEGEEESGSPSMVPFLEEHGDKLKADMVLVCDTGLYSSTRPGISTMLRGLMGQEVRLKGADRDLHSGLYGGAARNPIRVLTRVLGGLFDDDGRIQIPGFYDDVEELPAEVASQWQALNFDAEGFLGAVDLSLPAGEADRSPLEQLWSRPTAEINGILGGYTGAGVKTVLPAEASAKLTFRLVANQDPEKLRESFQSWVRDQLPADIKAEFIDFGAAPAVRMDVSAPAFEQARQALSQEWPEEAAFIGVGGSIPVVSHFQSILGMESLLVGFGRTGDRVHSPNERYTLDSFRRGTRSWARILAAISE